MLKLFFFLQTSDCSRDIDMTCKLEGSLTAFEDSWRMYVFIIMNYALSHTLHGKNLHHGLWDLSQKAIDSLIDSKFYL